MKVRGNECQPKDRHLWKELPTGTKKTSNTLDKTDIQMKGSSLFIPGKGEAGRVGQRRPWDPSSEGELEAKGARCSLGAFSEPDVPSQSLRNSKDIQQSALKGLWRGSDALLRELELSELTWQ